MDDEFDLPRGATHPIRFNMQVSLGNLIEVVVIVFAVSVAWANLNSRVSALEAQQATDARISVLETRVSQADKERSQLAVSLETRLARMEKKLDDALAHKGQ